MINRRDFVKTGTLLLFASSCKIAPPPPEFIEGESLAAISPINRIRGGGEQSIFTGDDPTVPHSILWNKEAFLREATVVSEEEVPLVVVGGGMSGLSSAYLLRDHQPLLLEQASRFGGNSKGEVWEGIPYSLGAAYIVKPDTESVQERLIRELQLDKEWIIKAEEDPVEERGGINRALWQSKERGVQRLGKYFKRVLNNEDLLFPDIPVEDAQRRGYVDALDKVSFYEHIIKKSGGTLPPSVWAAIEQYCWSSLGGSAREISAASGLNFYASEFGEIAIFPGGNSRIAEKMVEELQKTLPPSHLRSKSLVIDVTVKHDRTEVLYVDSEKRLRKIIAKACILSCPKFIAKHLLSPLEEERKGAIQRLRYRSYLVANVLLSEVPKEKFYDFYLLGEGHAPGQDTELLASKAKVTDVILANYAASHPSRAVLTLYRGLPYDNARPWLLNQSYETLKRAFETQLVEQIFPLLNLPSTALQDIRVTRWGHPLPLAEVGLISDNVPEALTKPFRERVFFIEQDNWALPAFETAVSEAFRLTPAVKEVLRA